MALGTYRLLRPLGSGRLAEVFEASFESETGFQRRVAVKRMRPEFLEDESLVAGFIDEARIACHLHHSKIVSVLDYGLIDGLPFLALEFVDGLDLGRLLTLAEERHSPPSTEMALYITAEIAHALAYAHEVIEESGRPLGIVHRDVAPQNILLSWAGDVMLTDFGVALAASRTTRTQIGVAKGTRAYMAPEQRLLRTVDGRADVYSLGCALHRLLTGRSPMSDPTRTDEILLDAPSVEDRLPDDVREFVKTATELDRTRRFPTAAAMARECGTLLARRLRSDARTLLREWLMPLRPRVESSPKSPIEQLFEPVLDTGDDTGVRRFVTRVPRGTGSWHGERAGEEEAGAEAEAQAEEEAEAEIGSMLQGYELLDVIGQGRSGRVFLGQHRELGRQCAIKVRKRVKGREHSGTLRFMNQARAMSHLAHPNLAKVFDSGTTNHGENFLIMEYIRGPTLSEAIRHDGPFDARRALEVSSQIAAGLAEAHAHAILHRDLTPSNVMFSEAGMVKLVDFSMEGAARFGDPPGSDPAPGTTTFVAPEQARNSTASGPSADLYSLGCILYLMLTGQPPYQGTASELLRQHLRIWPPVGPSARNLTDLVRRLLEVDPERRPGSAQQVLTALEGIRLTW